MYRRMENSTNSFVRILSKSPSAAAAVVLDRNANGRLEWKLVGSKLTYHQWQEERAKEAEVRQTTVGLLS